MIYEEIKSELMANFRRQMNGAVVDAMKAYSGGDAMLSYGVSIPTIKSICGEHERDNKLAKFLFHTKVRELKLAAIFLSDSNTLEAEQIESWATEQEHDEILMHLSALVGASPLADFFFERWINQSNPKLVKCALLVASHKLRGGEEVKMCKELLFLNLDKCDGFTLNSYVSLIGRISLSDNLFAPELINRISESDNKHLKELISFL